VFLGKQLGRQPKMRTARYAAATDQTEIIVSFAVKPGNSFSVMSCFENHFVVA
jgi:hypothetical protein